MKTGSAVPQGSIGKVGNVIADEAQGADTETPPRMIHHHPVSVKVYVQYVSAFQNMFFCPLKCVKLVSVIQLY